MNRLPQKPGVYTFRDKGSKPLYVGKASNLKNRVKSYFQKNSDLGPKTTLMVSKIKKIEHIIVESELEALLLEADLIKRLKPKYNVRWKDDKRYQYIKISKVKTQSSKLSSKQKTPDFNDYPKVSTSRKIDDKGHYFGPFPEGRTVRFVLHSLRKIFPFRDCSHTKFKRYQSLKRPCLYGYMNLCSAPCVGQISPGDYQKNITRLKNFLRGRNKTFLAELKKEMGEYSQNKEFEAAARIRDQIKAYEYISQEFRQPQEYLKDPNLLADQRQREIEDLRKRLEIEIDLRRIEAYDISNIFGEFAVGSMVVFLDGAAEKSHYRRFKIKSVRGISDVEMIKEVLRRRFARFARVKPVSEDDKSFDELPDLILVDGGKPQVSAAKEILNELGFKVRIIGLAKREEIVVTAELKSLDLPKDSLALHLLQRIRDESHRFALAYHKKLRTEEFKHL